MTAIAVRLRMTNDLKKGILLFKKILKLWCPSGLSMSLLLLVCIMGCYADDTNLNVITLPSCPCSKLVSEQRMEMYCI